MTHYLIEMMDSNNYSLQYKGAAISIFIHIIVLVIGFSVLATVFEFPEVLRESAEYRLRLYREGQSVIMPIYWLLAMTGFSQIAMTVFLHRSFQNRNSTILHFALIFGILTGILQTLGFIRWAILIPYLAEQITVPTATATTREIIALLEGAFNRYAGMAIGEHTANICLGLWTLLLGVSMLKRLLFDRRLGWVGIGIGMLAMCLALEQLGIAPALFEILVDFGFPLWAVWLVVLGVSLLRTKADRGEGPSLTWKTLLWAVVLYVLLTLLAL
jgi:hypothetical protein